MCFLSRFAFRPPSIARRCAWLAGWGLLCVGTGCSRRFPGRQSTATTAAATANVPGAAAVRFLGSVHVIGTDGRFVLVESSSPAVAAALTEGQTLVCRAAGADTATLHVAYERRPPFVVADVASGEPHVGDEVFVVPAPDPAAKPAPSAPPPVPPFRANPSPPPAS